MPMVGELTTLITLNCAQNVTRKYTNKIQSDS
jgi:hypothetical protein